MTRNLLSSPRRRGVIGAIIGAVIPYGFGASGYGFALGWNTEVLWVIGGFSTFFALFGYGVFHGGFKGNGLREPGGEDTNRWTESDRAHDDLIHQNSVHASTRVLWDNQYK